MALAKLNWPAEHRRNPTLADIALLVSLGVLAVGSIPDAKWLLAPIGAPLAAVAAMRMRGPALPAGLIISTLCLYFGLVDRWFVWPLYLLVPLFLTTGIVVASRHSREISAAVCAGRLGRIEALLILLLSLMAGTALLSWVWIMSPDLDPFRTMLPDWPIAALIGAALIFSVTNAILEEIIWRGLLQRWLLSFAPPSFAILIQAVSFGFIHFSGFPGGAVGVLLATLYGAMIGCLAVRARGLVAPIIAHIAADLVIFSLVSASA